MENSFHFPPELMSLLIDTVPRLFRSKNDVLLFFQGAGVPRSLMRDLEARVKTDKENITKFEIARVVLTRLNENGIQSLRERREIIKRVTEFDDFSTCWEKDRLEAQGLVAQIRQVVNVKDSFSRIKNEHQEEIRKTREIARHEEENKRKRHQEAIDAIRNDLSTLSRMPDSEHQRRGKLLESVLNRLFELNGILVRDAFNLVGNDGEGIIEQIDGVIEIDGEIYLVEMKWWNKPLGKAEIGQHLVRVFNRSDARGIYISASGYTEPAIRDCELALQNKVMILCSLQEIIILLERQSSLLQFLKAKIQAAIIDKQPFYQII